MFFILSKILSFLISPLNWCILLLIFSLVLKNRKIKIFLFRAALVIILVFTNEAIYNVCMSSWEMSPKNVEQCTEKYDYTIVLSGMGSFNEKYNMMFFSGASDRIMQAIALYKRGKTDKILLTGGSGEILDQKHKESNYLRDYLLQLGIPDNDIIIETRSRNTHENARYTAEILEKKAGDDYLLITSSYHIRRALGCFKNEGVSVTPYPTDIQTQKFSADPGFLIVPSAYILRNWEMLIHEIIGYGAYKLYGYI